MVIYGSVRGVQPGNVANQAFGRSECSEGAPARETFRKRKGGGDPLPWSAPGRSWDFIVPAHNFCLFFANVTDIWMCYEYCGIIGVDFGNIFA